MSSELGPESQAILEAGRHGDEPTAADRARVRASLVQVIAAGGVGAAAAAVGKTAAASMAPKAAAGAVAKTAPLGAALAGKLVTVVALTSALGGGVWYASTRGPTTDAATMTPSTADQARTSTPSLATPRAPDAPLAAPPPEVPSDEAPVNAAGAAEDPVKPEARRAPQAGATASADPLEAEARRLRGAHAAIQAGDAERALADLDAQNRAYAGGQLGEERSATRVLALCKLGRTNEAKAAAARFIADHPRSPLVDRMRTPCSEGR